MCSKSSLNFAIKKETRETNKIALLAFKVFAISSNTLLTPGVQLLETVCIGFFRYSSKHRCHTLLDLSCVGKVLAFQNFFEAKKQEEVLENMEDDPKLEPGDCPGLRGSQCATGCCHGADSTVNSGTVVESGVCVAAAVLKPPRSI